MENQSFSTPLQLKLSLLKSLRQGNLDDSQSLLAQLTTKTKTHPQLYHQFHQFVQEHKQEIKQLDQEDKEQQNIVIVDADAESKGSSWATDDSVSLSSQESEEEISEKKEVKVKSRLFKNVANSKSAVLLKPVKQVKRPFYVQTKPKQNVTSSTINLRQSSPSSKLLVEYKTQGGSDSKAFAKVVRGGSKKSIKPYFPPINASKPCLKI